MIWVVSRQRDLEDVENWEEVDGPVFMGRKMWFEATRKVVELHVRRQPTHEDELYTLETVRQSKQSTCVETVLLSHNHSLCVDGGRRMRANANGLMGF